MEYDKVPYSNNILTQTHPDVHASFAALLGLNPPQVEKARILELGCGNGINLICHAADLPDSEFVGIDLAESHIDKAKLTAEQFGVPNVAFHHKDLMDLSEDDFGKFDYIVAHGLISWVPPAVREKTFSIIRQMLSKNGIGYLSYNTYPVWHYLQMVSRIGRMHARDIDDPSERAKSALSFINLLGESAPAETLYQSIFREESEYLEKLPETSVIHDMFAEINEPLYFVDFVSELKKNGLKFVAEVESHSSRLLKLPPQALQMMDGIEDAIWREQYLDFFGGRAFRQTLVCHEEVEFDYLLEPAALENLFLASSLKPVSEKPELHTSKPEKFAATQGGEIETAHPLTKTVLLRLGEVWGNTVSYTTLLGDAKQFLIEGGLEVADWSAEFETARSAIMQLILQTDLIEIHTYQADFDTTLDKKPALKALAQNVFIESDFVFYKYNRGTPLEDPVMRQLLQLLDGSRTASEVETDLVNFINSSDEIAEKKTVIENLVIENELTRLARLGIFSR